MRHPNEILLLIFDHLAQETEPERLVPPPLHVFHARIPLLRVCRAWYNLFLPKVYHFLELHSVRQLYPLARSLQRKPNLGSSVRRLQIDFSNDEDRISYDRRDEPLD